MACVAFIVIGVAGVIRRVGHTLPRSGCARITHARLRGAPHDEHQHDQQHEHHGQKRHRQGDVRLDRDSGFWRVADDVREVRPRGEFGTTIGPEPDSGMAGVCPLGDSVEVADDSWGKSGPASSHSGQSSRHTSVSALTRPSVSQRCMTSPAAGPNCPPLGGLTYHTAAGVR